MKRFALISVVSLLAIWGCDDDFNPGVEPNVEPNNTVDGLLYGEACSGDSECRAGLVCTDDLCAFAGALTGGDPCRASGECGDGLYCDASVGVCAEAGTAGEGESCSSTADCTGGLRCNVTGFNGGECVSGGTTDIGGACESTADCLAGLGCNPDPQNADATICQAGPAGLPRPWTGVECEPNDEDGDFKAFFDVPTEGEEVTEFYRLPFPNDIRRDGSRIDLSGHPTPGDSVLGFDPVQRYIDAIEAGQDKFSLNPVVTFRFNRAFDFDSVDANGDSATLRFRNITPESPNYAGGTGLSWRSNTGRNKYLCQNSLTVRPRLGSLSVDTTYAAFLTAGVRGGDGSTPVRDDDFAAVMAESDPGGELSAAWQAYQPFRDYLADQEIDPNTVVAAAVFTTGNPRTTAQNLAAAASQTPPSTTDLTLCDGAATSPCDDGSEEPAVACSSVNGAFHEIHGRFDLPVFQEGDAPYLESGGAVADDPSEVRREDVCMAMTVPKSTMPQTGWPVIVYAHGTEGSATSHVDQISEGLSAISEAGQDAGFIVIGWDQVLHGSRKNGSDERSNNLVFNYANPDAAQGNFHQGAADIHAVVEFVKTIDISAEDSPTGEAITADPANIWFYGHSQGGQTGPLAIPHNPDVQGAVLSGAGASLTEALLGKKTPIDSLTVMKFVLQDTALDSTHPVLALLQGYFDPVDPLNYAALVSARQIEGVTTRSNVFHTYGVGDTYTPPAGLAVMARNLRATYLTPGGGEPIDGVPTAEAPLSGNVTAGEEVFTAAGRQYDPEGAYDGHFVAWRHPVATADIINFLTTGYFLGVPELR